MSFLAEIFLIIYLSVALLLVIYFFVILMRVYKALKADTKKMGREDETNN